MAADRLSGWTEQQRIKVGTNEAGAQGLCKALRRIFVTFGVPVESSSDGGTEFIFKEHVCFNHHSLNADLALPRFAHALIL